MDGVLLLDKPAGMTSHDCVAIVRRLLKTKKVGHTGTLDPSVTGVLPLCIGRATKLSQFLTAEAKEYIAEVTLGFATTTEDADGEEIDRQLPDSPITNDMAQHALAGLLGTSSQTPPMYSAVKVNGKKLYEYARQGIEVERPSREITIYRAELLGDVVKNSDGTYTFAFLVKGSKGLYVRTVATTLGEKLGYPAHMSKLRRTASGTFEIGDCLGMDQLEELSKTPDKLPLISMEKALEGMPRVAVSGWVEKLVRNGGALEFGQVPAMEGLFAIYNESGQVLAVYEFDASKGMNVSVRGF
ncbi:MAG: tRNA pseudouridine(55) synthase TruB [Turicibacter sp.]|nr:tRNA pseudouridine(55) synthase TruB [Turicibacter sp.]